MRSDTSKIQEELEKTLGEFDDDGNGQLSLDEFRDMIAFLTDKDLSDTDLLDLFKEVRR